MLPYYMQPIIFLEVRVVNHSVYKLNLNVDSVISALLSQFVQVTECIIMELCWLRWHILLLLHFILLASPINVILFTLSLFLLLF